MPTYTTSPQDTDLQTYIFKASNIDVAGKDNLIGSAKSVYAIQISNGGGAYSYVSMWDADTITAAAADILIPVNAATDMTVYIDNGIVFSTNICMNGSDAVTAGGAPTDLDITVFAK
jgi:hypothetical protein